MPDTSGQAFPMLIPNNYDHATPGMTLRQWYAGMALQGFMAAYTKPKANLNPELVARDAFIFADAMLTAGETI